MNRGWLKAFTWPGVVLVAVNFAVNIGIRYFSPEMPSGIAYEYDNETEIFKWFLWFNSYPNSLAGWILSPISRSYMTLSHPPRWLDIAFTASFLFLVAVQWLAIGYGISLIFRHYRDRLWNTKKNEQ